MVTYCCFKGKFIIREIALVMIYFDPLMRTTQIDLIVKLARYFNS